MQLLKPFFALLYATLATTSPITTKDDASLVLSERASASSQLYTYWNSQSGRPVAGLDDGVHLFAARWPRDDRKDIDMPQIIKDARNFVNANHFVLEAVTVATDHAGALDVTAFEYWDVTLDVDTNKIVLGVKGERYDTERARAGGITHTYLNKIGTRSRISTVGKFIYSSLCANERKRETTGTLSLILLYATANQYIKSHPTYNAQTNNCKSFVDGVALGLKG